MDKLDLQFRYLFFYARESIDIPVFLAGGINKNNVTAEKDDLMILLIFKLAKINILKK